MKTHNLFMAALVMLALTAAPAAARNADFTNHIGMKFKTIPAGSFYMGSCKQSDDLKKINKKRRFLGLSPKGVACPSGARSDNDASDSETPQHKVTISKGFQMGVYEVTLGQFKKFIGAAGRDDLISDDFIKYNSHGDNAAVSYVSWNDARAFIHWLNKAKPASDKGVYRLPTEAEWEYSARAGTTTVYSWGNSKRQAGTHAWYDKNAYDVGQKYAHSVGRKKTNPWGLYDMHGNVWEWVHDWYGEKYYSSSPSNNPKGPASGSYRVIRGGCWLNYARLLRSAIRYYYSPDIRIYILGFRLLRQP